LRADKWGDYWCTGPALAPGCAAPLTRREEKAFSVARKGKAVVLLAEKCGSGATPGTDILPQPSSVPGTAQWLIADRPHEQQQQQQLKEEGEEEEEEEDQGDQGEEEREEREEEEGGADGYGHGTTTALASFTPIPGDHLEVDTPPVWLDEVQLRGGRKRFSFADEPIARSSKLLKKTNGGIGGGGGGGGSGGGGSGGKRKRQRQRRRRQTRASAVVNEV